jgi:hypothetical protein
VIQNNVKYDLIGLSDYVWSRLRHRLEGMTDDEYFWEPVPGCWSLRSGEDGSSSWDHAFPPPEPAPITTIAWRLAHIAGHRSTGNGAGDRHLRAWLGLAPADLTYGDDLPVVAAAAITTVEQAAAEMHEILEEMSAEDLSEKIGPVGGMYADYSRTSYVLHILDEVIHHSAEIALLRDLYRATRGQRI